MAHARALPSGRWQGIAKQGRTRLGTKTFGLRREAIAWATRTEAAAAGGLDPRAGRAQVRVLLPEWIEHRGVTVAPKTARTDAELSRLLSPALGAMSVAAVTPRAVETWLLYLRQVKGQGDTSIRRYKASLSAFFAWAAADSRITVNPVAAAKPPRPLAPPAEMRPFSEAELAALIETAATRDPRSADLLAVLGWTGLRWAEARALLVSDFTPGPPTPFLRVSRSQPEGHPIKSTKGGRSRRVPLAAPALAAVERLAAGKSQTALLLTTSTGGQLWGGAFRRSTDWPAISDGRRLHDLRHTAATIWLRRGVDLGTVQAWLGHASPSTTERYLHHLGTSADAHGLALLNSWGAYGAHAEASAPSVEGTDA